MANLQLFQRYATAENVVTNNTLLLFQRVYQHSPARFRQLMLTLWESGHAAPDFGLRFAQQVRGHQSVPDGVLVQESVKVVVETKLGKDFDTDQVRRHFAELTDYKHRFALMLGSDDIDLTAPRYESLFVEASKLGSALAAVSFETLIARVKELYGAHHEDMVELATDFEGFCDSFGLLPADKWTVFVPPCGQSLQHNLSERLYYCPSERTVRKTKYLGIYADKTIQAIGAITNVIVAPFVSQERQAIALGEGESLRPDEAERILRACAAAKALGWDIDMNHTFFLCDEMQPTDFRKGSRGGIQNRRYLDLRKALNPLPTGLRELAQALRAAKPWE